MTTCYNFLRTQCSTMQYKSFVPLTHAHTHKDKVVNDNTLMHSHQSAQTQVAPRYRLAPLYFTLATSVCD